MDSTQTPTPQATGNSTAAADSGGPHQPSTLAIVIPLVVLFVCALAGLAICVFLRRWRLKAERSRSAGESTGTASLLVTAPVMEEGLNELGEAPPPYGTNEADKEAPSVDEMELAEAPAQPPPAYITAMAVAGTRDRDENP